MLVHVAVLLLFCIHRLISLYAQIMKYRHYKECGGHHAPPTGRKCKWATNLGDDGSTSTTTTGSLASHISTSTVVPGGQAGGHRNPSLGISPGQPTTSRASKSVDSAIPSTSGLHSVSQPPSAAGPVPQGTSNINNVFQMHSVP